MKKPDTLKKKLAKLTRPELIELIIELIFIRNPTAKLTAELDRKK